MSGFIVTQTGKVTISLQDFLRYMTWEDQTAVRTRPIFPYRMQARYSGGSIDDAANFVGVMPSQTPNGSCGVALCANRIDWIGNDLFLRSNCRKLQRYGSASLAVVLHEVVK
jgi:hypothetical protein